MLNETVLQTKHVSELRERDPEQLWLIDRLWPMEGLGILGGGAKEGKTFLAVDMAVSIASGTPCLGVLASRLGPVLYFPAEGRECELRGRFESVCRRRGLLLADLQLKVIAEDRLHLDTEEGQKRLQKTLETYPSDLLIIDPLRRVMKGDENSSAAVSEVLNGLLGIQRATGTAILVLHHIRKNSTSTDGRDLRGSSDLHAWGDANLYLKRDKELVTVKREFRDDREDEKLQLNLTTIDGATAYEIVDPSDTGVVPQNEREQRIIDALSRAGAIKPTALLTSIGMRRKDFYDALRCLRQKGIVTGQDEIELVVTGSGSDPRGPEPEPCVLDKMIVDPVTSDPTAAG